MFKVISPENKIHTFLASTKYHAIAQAVGADGGKFKTREYKVYRKIY